MADAEQKHATAAGEMHAPLASKETNAEETDEHPDTAASVNTPLAATTVEPTLSPPVHPSEGDGDQALELIRRGSMLIKVRSVGRRYRRNFYVDNDCAVLRYRDSHKGNCVRWLRGNEPDQRKIPIKSIKEVRDSARPNAAFKPFHSRLSNMFTVVVGEELKPLDLAAETANDRDAWVNGLRLLMKRCKNADPEKMQMMWLTDQFQDADVNGDGFLNSDETRRLVQSLSMCPISTNTYNSKSMKSKYLLEDFIDFFKTFSKRHEIDALFKQYAASDIYIDAAELVTFFVTEQQEHLEQEEAEQLIQIHEPCPNLKKKKLLSSAGFNTLLSSERMNIRKPLCRTVYQDMTQPLSHYFINSSHNTYLEGNQLFGESTTQAYVRVLEHRCRCVELDVHDGYDDEPIIFHGKTITTKITLLDVLAEINRYAFTKSEYPLILSIENHCSIQQQRTMAKHLRDTFGDQLLTEPLDKDCTCLPSPEALKRRVIVKGKKISAKSSDQVELKKKDGHEKNGEVKRKSKKEEKHEVPVELSDCVVICQTTTFTGFEKSKPFAKMSSFDESKALKLAKKDRMGFVRHNTQQLSRIYPSGTRFGSGNYNPVPMWNVGCQIVALNFQTREDPMFLNYGRFEDNGACGYVLKPEFLRSDVSNFDYDGPFAGEEIRSLTVRVISGFNLPKKPGDGIDEILDPYVLVEVVGVPDDNQTQRTQAIKNNGFLPVWNKTLAPFKIHCPALAIVMFKVFDKGNDDVTVAQYCLPFTCIQTGYRMVALRDRKGNVVGPTSLFVHITIGPSTAG